MENSIKLMLFLSFCFVSNQALLANASVPALYVFGDSHLDPGNNMHLNTPAKPNRWPYAIDFHNIRGRFTNGRNMADFIASYLDLPFPPAYLNLSDTERSQTTTGISYASASCGILNTTGAGECLTLAKQVGCFTSTVKNDLPQAIMDHEKLQDHLTNSLYLVFIGNNDYHDAMSHNVSNKFSPDKYADILLDEVTKHIKTLYDLGARKFVVSGISRCQPHNYTKDCKSRYFADKLPQRLQELRCTLSGSLFTVYDVVNVYKKITDNPQKYGFTNIQDPCYPEGRSLCKDRKKYLRFDQYSHETEAAYEIASKDCFYGQACSPYSILELAKAPIISHH